MWPEFAQKRLKVVGSGALQRWGRSSDTLAPMGCPLPDAFGTAEAEAYDLGLWMGSGQVRTSLGFVGAVWKLQGQRQVTTTTLT